MRAAASRNFAIILAIIFSVALIQGAEQVVAQAACPSGTVAITDATRADATIVGLPTSVQCWNPNDPNNGLAAANAKLWLQQHATKGANVSCLNAHFAEKLQTLMQAVPGGIPVITDGYRSPQTQANLPAGSTQVGACGSYHQYGLAADFNNASKATLLWMRQNAPQYGLTPIPSLNVQTGCSNVSSFCDPGHIQIQGPLPPRNQCGICNSNVTGTLSSGAVPTPTSGITSALQSVLGRQPTPAVTAAQPIQASAPLPVAAAPASVLTTPPLSATTPVSGSLPSTVTANPTLALPEPIANLSATTSTAIGTSTSIGLNSNAGDIGETNAAQYQNPVATTSQNSGAINPEDQSTFASGNLDGNNGYSPQSGSALQNLLTKLKAVLVNILIYLQPFGGQIPSQQQYAD